MQALFGEYIYIYSNIYIYIYTRVLPSISIDDDRFEEYGVLMALQEIWLVLMLWTGLEDLGALDYLVCQERLAERVFWTSLDRLGRGHLDEFESCGRPTAPERRGTID